MDIKENFLRAIKFKNPEWVPTERESLFRQITYENDYLGPEESGIDLWGVEWESRDPRVMPLCTRHPLLIEDEKAIADFKPPDISKIKIDSESQKILSSSERKDLILLGFHPQTLFERAWMLASMEGFMTAIALYPERIRILFSKIMDFNIKVAEIFLSRAVDGCYLNDDFGSQTSLMLSPAMWRELIKPEYKRIISLYKSKGKIVFLHSCGCIQQIIPDLIELGINILNPVQARANNLKEIGEKFSGKIVFCGGIDTQYTLMLGTPDDVRKEVRQCMDYLKGKNGGFIIGPDQSMPFPKENEEALYDEARIRGKY